jgi:hypothetical protein
MLSDAYTDVHFNFGFELLFDFFLQPSQHERPQYFMQLVDDSFVTVFFLLRSLFLLSLFILSSA